MSTTICYMCGDSSTQRHALDPDVKGVPLCNDEECHRVLTTVLSQPDLDMNQGLVYFLNRSRQKMHKAKGNKYDRKAQRP